MKHRSRHRLIAAAGAAVAGAVIPIAAAASAWADGLTETEDFGQLVGQGLNYYEAYEIVQAEGNGLPVEVSYDGQVVVEDNEPANPLLGAVAESGTGNDVAAAIATNSPAIENQTIADAANGNNDTAFADGGGNFALAGNEIPVPGDNGDAATAIGTYSFAYADAGSNNTATDIGSNSFADATANSDTVYDIGSGVGNGANNVSAGGGDDFVVGLGNGLPNTDVVNTGVFDIVTPQSGGDALSAASTAAIDPASQLSDATSALTSGSQALDSINIAGLSDTLAHTVSNQVGFDDRAITDIDNLAANENLITANDGGFANIVDALLNPINQNIAQSSEAVLAADQAFQAALAIDTGGFDPTTVAADFGLLTPDFTLLGDLFNAAPVDFLGQLF